MKKYLILVCLLSSVTLIVHSQTKQSTLAQIIIYKGDVAGTGPGLNTLKLAVGEEDTVTAKGVDENGNDVPIWPTWKCDSELSIKVVEGKSKTVIVKAMKESSVAAFFTAVYITDEGKKVTADGMVQIKAK